MAFIEWSDEFSVGHEVMDTQHKRLVSIINELYDVLQDKQDPQFEKRIRTLMNDLIRFIQDHFVAEERLMAQSSYPVEKLLEHRGEHNQLIRETAEMQNRITRNNYQDADAMLPFLYGEWLMRHICESDKAYVPYLKAASDAPVPGEPA